MIDPQRPPLPTLPTRAISADELSTGWVPSSQLSDASHSASAAIVHTSTGRSLVDFACENFVTPAPLRFSYSARGSPTALPGSSALHARSSFSFGPRFARHATTSPHVLNPTTHWPVWFMNAASAGSLA